MNAAQLHGIVHIASGLILLVLATVSFFIAKRGAKKFLRILVEESSKVEDDYRMLRGLLALLVAGLFFMILFIWGIARMLTVNEWINVWVV